MAIRRVRDAANNRFAVMQNATPANSLTDPSFISPLAHLPDIKWHSSLYYLGIVTTLTGTINLQIDGTWTSSQIIPGGAFSISSSIFTKSLGAHGQSYTPIILGYLTIGGHNVPIMGDFIARAGYESDYSVYADATNVYIAGKQFLHSGSTAANTVSYTIYICNIGYDASNNLVLPPLNSGWNSSTSRVRCGYYDTNFGYFNKDASGPMALSRGKGSDVQVGWNVYSGSQAYGVGIVTNINGYVDVGIGSHPTTGGRPGTQDIATNTPFFTPTVTQISASLPAGSAALNMGAGRIKFGDVLDTNKNTFLITDYVPYSGTNASQTVGVFNGTFVTRTIDLGAVNSFATDVMGYITVFGRTFPIGGTQILYSVTGLLDPSVFLTSASGFQGTWGVISSYFQISGGHLQLIVDYKFAEISSGSVTFPAFAVDVRAFVGTFDY